MAHEYCEKVMIVNAKISEKSLKRWKIFKQFKEEIFDSIDICYPQNEENQLRLIELGVQNTNYIGNLKFSVSKLEINKKYLNELKESIGKRPFVLCASNHLEETELIYQLYEKLKKKFNDLIFILACRHPNKADEINNYLVKNFQITKRKTKNEIIDDKTNFYLYDEMGEMGTLYELSDIVLVCGSLVDGIGGHTPVEPAKHNCAIITAPFIKNNESLFEELKKVEGCIVVENEKNFIAELEEKIEKLLNFPNDVKKLQINAENICNKFSHVVEETAKSIINNLK
jgi:3-deoxy-D-manno-octulosonic-acid transferase